MVIACILFCCSCSVQNSTAIPELLTPVKVEPDTAMVQYEDVFNLTGIIGSVFPYSEALAFSVDGTLGSFEVLPGQNVKKGDLIAVLDTSALQQQLDSLRTQLNRAKNEAALTNRNLELDIQICRLKLAAGDGDYEKKLLQLDLQEAELKLKQTKEQQAFSQQQLTETITGLTAQIDSAVIRAPFDGTVSWISAKASPGSAVSAKDAICYISDVSRLCVRTERISSSILQGCDRIYAKIEYGRRDIGSAVPEAIYNAVAADQQLSSPNDIDDIEKWSLDKATADGISVFWCVEVETRHKEVDIYVNDSPVRIIPRPVIDMGNTGGNGLPVEDEIERFLNDRYPGAKVVERDYDDGCLELTILHENLRKEVLFDGRNNWLRTEWELHRLPQNILDAVQQAGYTLDDDEFECIETSGGMWYEFEARKDRREYDLRVDTNGNIEAYED